MDDGRDLPIEAENAADAIQEALEQHRGHRVCACYKGARDRKGVGYLEYEVPRHDPVPETSIDTPAPGVQSKMF